MFTITIITENHKSWNPQYCFTSYSDASGYLIKQDYLDQRGWFQKPASVWGGATRAYINPVEIYDPALAHTYKH